MALNTICRANPDPAACMLNKPRFVRKDLDEKVESYFLQVVYEAYQCYNDPADLCMAIKQCLDKRFGYMWHVVVGPEFARAFSDYFQPGLPTDIMYNYRQTCSYVTDSRNWYTAKPKYLQRSLEPEYESDILYWVRQVYDSYDDPEEMCTALKYRLEDRFGPTWHVIVGDYFGSHFEHEPKSFCYITYQGLSFLMFKFG